MAKNIKSIMAQYLLANESELFASNMNFKMCDDSLGNKYKSNDPSLKQEYTLINLNQKMSSVI